MRISRARFQILSQIEYLVAASVMRTKREFESSALLADIPRLKKNFVRQMMRHYHDETQHGGALKNLSHLDTKPAAEKKTLPQPQSMLEASDHRVGNVSLIPIRWRFVVMAALEVEGERFYREMSMSLVGHFRNAVEKIASDEARHSEYLLALHRCIHPRTWRISWLLVHGICSVGTRISEQCSRR